MQDIRNRFDQVAGNVIVHYSSVSEEQRQQALQFQGMLCAIHFNQELLPPEQRKNLYAIKNIEAAQSIITEQNIPQSTVENGLSAATNQQGVPRDVPVVGDLFVKLGFVSGEVKDLLMALQAGERTRRSQEGNPNKFFAEITEQGLLNADFSNRNFRREYADTGKPNTVKAQSINHLADILVTATKIKPELHENEYVKNAMKSLTGLSYHIYRENYKMLRTLSLNPDNAIQPQAYKDAWAVAKAFKEEHGAGRYNLPAAMKILDKGLREAVKNLDMSADKKQELNQILDIRQNCVRGAGRAR